MPYPGKEDEFQTYREFKTWGGRRYMKFTPCSQNATGTDNAKKWVICTCYRGDTYCLWSQMYTSDLRELLKHRCAFENEDNLISSMRKRR
ncbi:MAG: hypothetical protein EZS28_045645 [Streblomastix strix]|uniref:Uncharacterized protein n=1 Tax=Streblomastix strix TaxID=222440 RepID=A0A5J4TLK1_9EUKA|nr:MAG: hypothetical protein EZS28_045645 [Streblomastix strix]